MRQRRPLISLKRGLPFWVLFFFCLSYSLSPASLATYIPVHLFLSLRSFNHCLSLSNFKSPLYGSILYLLKPFHIRYENGRSSQFYGHRHHHVPCRDGRDIRCRNVACDLLALSASIFDQADGLIHPVCLCTNHQSSVALL